MTEAISRYIEEMKRGLAGSGSIRMIPTWLGADMQAVEGEEVLVIDAGGTNLRVARVCFENGALRTLARRDSIMPGTMGEVTVEEFNREIADEIIAVRGNATRCGYCFSYPAEILENRDGRIIRFQKDVRVRGAEGLVIGEALNAELARRGEPPMQYSILNDTVATFFAGMTNFSAAAPASVIGVIWGTGYNVCYMERAENIVKIDAKYDMAINMETGNYDGVPLDAIDEIIDETSDNPGIQHFEKQIAGAYLGRILYYRLLVACDAGEFDDHFRAALIDKGGIRTPEMSRFYAGVESEDEGLNALCLTAEEEEKVKRMIVEIADRAAAHVAMNLAGIIRHLDIGKTADAPAIIAIEGTTYQKFTLLQDLLQAHMNAVVRDELGRHFTIAQMQESNLLGSALAAFACQNI